MAPLPCTEPGPHRESASWGAPPTPPLFTQSLLLPFLGNISCPPPTPCGPVLCVGDRAMSQTPGYHFPSSWSQDLGRWGWDRSPLGRLWVDPRGTPSHLLESQGSGGLPHPPTPWSHCRQTGGHKAQCHPITHRASAPDSCPGWASSPTSGQVVSWGLLLPSGGRDAGPHKKATLPPPKPWRQRGVLRPGCQPWLTLANSLLSEPQS